MVRDDGTRGLSREVIGVAIEIHKKFGAGLLEDAYYRPMVWALEKRRFEIETEVPLSIEFEGQVVQRACIIDIVVKRGDIRLLLEIKSVAMTLPIHIAQVTTYLSLSGIPVGLLMNFNVQVMRHGIKRVFHPDLRRDMRAATVSPRATEGSQHTVDGDSGRSTRETAVDLRRAVQLLRVNGPSLVLIGRPEGEVRNGRKLVFSSIEILRIFVPFDPSGK